jgi:hypothetical protein
MSRLDALVAGLSEWIGQEITVEILYLPLGEPVEILNGGLGEPVAVFGGVLGEPVEDRPRPEEQEVRRVTWPVGESSIYVDSFALDGANAGPSGVEALLHETYMMRVTLDL